MANNVVLRRSLTGLLAATTYTVEIPREKLIATRHSFYVIPVGDNVTVNIRCLFPTVGGPDDVLLAGAIGGAAADGEAFIFTTEDVYPGPVFVDVVVGGGPPPSRVEVVVAGL